MLAAGEGPGAIFAGVRFVLFGFDSVSEAQYRSEIVRRGGVDVGRYDSNCTHVIVSGRVSDDPVCVTARKDGKVLVSELWIDDCLDFGTLVDANRVLYKPVKDLNGIPGSEALNICLTGYQRQDRDDIMKMVSLIGARFSKPLIANQVTHLICYKFEGEKYELARKVGIKLVNHRWLEDCLKVWEILPIDNYTKSGWELEILEAQARDSEEETEDGGRSAMRKRSSIGSSSLQGGVPSSTNLDVSVPAKDAENLLMNDRSFMTTPHKEPSYGKSFGTSGFINKVIGDHNHQNDVGTNQAGGDHETVYAKSNGDMSIQGDTILKEGEAPSSNKRDIKISPNPAAAKESSSTLSYSRKTPRKLVSAELPNNLSGSPEGISRENLTVQPNFLQFEPSESRTHLEPAGAQSPIRVVAHHIDSPASAMTVKRRSPLSSSDSKLLNSGCRGLEARAIHGPLPSLGPSGSIAALFREGIDYRLGVDNSLEKAAHTESGGHQSMDSSMKLPKLGCQGSEAHATQDPLASSGQFGSNAALFREGIHYGLGVDNSLERATNTESGGHQPTDSTKVKRSSYQKRSLKLVQPFKKSKISNSRDATGGDLENSQSKLEPSEVLAAQMSELHNTSTRENVGSCVTASPTGGKTFPNLPLVGGTLQTRDVNITDQSHYTETLVIDERMINDASGKEQPFENLGDVNISDTANNQIKEIELHQKANHDEVFMSSDSKEAETRKQPNIENVETHNKDDSKTASCMKKVVSKKSSYRHTLSNDNDKKDRIVTSSDKIESSDSHNKIYTSIQSSEKHGKATRIRKCARTEKGRATLKSEKKGNAEDKQELGKKIIYEQNGTNAATEDDMIMEDAVESNSMSTRSILNVTKNRMESSNKEMKEVRLPNSGSNCKDLETNSAENSIDSDKEDKPMENGYLKMELNDNCNHKSRGKNKKKSAQNTRGDNNNVLWKSKCAEIEKPPPACFILSGHRLQRKEFQKVIRHLRGRLCRDSHQWSYQATHFIVPDPVRRTEKFFAAAASGRWILKTDYLTASNDAGKFLDEESFEWHRKGLTEDGAISLEAPRKWRLLRERTGHGAFYGMRIIVYGECIAPTLDTLKRVVKAGDGTILATSPPYTRFLKSGVDYAIVSPSMPSVDIWVQEFLRHEVPCIVADYLVEYVCKPGYSLERHVLYKTHAWAEKSSANLLRLSEQVVTENSLSLEDNSDDTDDLCCTVCGLRDRAEVMLVCGDEDGTVGCGIGTHIDCCDPQLDAIPEEDWFCPNCSNRTSSKASLNNKRAKKSSSSKVK